MSELKIDDAARDQYIEGAELIPVSDGGKPKSVSVADIKDFTLGQAAALANATGVTLAADGVYIKQGGALKPVSAQTFADAVLAAAFGKSAASSISGSETVIVQSGGTAKTATVSDVAAYFKTVVGTLAANFDIGGLAAATAAKGSQKIPVCETDANGNATNKSLTLAKLKAYASPLDAAETRLSIKSTDFLLCCDVSGNPVLIPQSLFTSGKVTTPTANSVADGQLVAFSGNTGSAIKGGPAVVTSVRAAGQTSAEAVPTETAVRAALTDGMSAVGNAAVAPSSTTAGKVPTWSSTQKTLEDGWPVKNVAFDETVTANGSDNAIPTAYAVAQFVAARKTLCTVLTKDTLYDNVTGYAPGEMYVFVKTDGTYVLKINVGTKTSAKWAIFTGS